MAPHLFSTIFGRYGMQKDVRKAPCFGFSSMVLFFLAVVLLLAVPRGVCAEETVMTEELSMEIRTKTPAASRRFFSARLIRLGTIAAI